MRSWVFLLYKLRPEPSAPRVQVWRKLKRLGALLLHDAVWVLPATAYAVEQMQWLAQEIQELDGNATVWEARASLPGQDAALERQFALQADAAYREIQPDDQVALERGQLLYDALTTRSTPNSPAKPASEEDGDSSDTGCRPALAIALDVGMAFLGSLLLVVTLHRRSKAGSVIGAMWVALVVGVCVLAWRSFTNVASLNNDPIPPASPNDARSPNRQL